MAEMCVTKERRDEEKEAIRKRLKQVRDDVKNNNTSLTEQLKTALGRCAGVTTVTAEDPRHAVSYIGSIAGETRLASINRSSIVVNELRDELHSSGFRTYLRYYGEFHNFEEEKFEKRFGDYWSLPGLNTRGLAASFDVGRKIARAVSTARRDYLAILGVNAISASDGSVYFLQHMANISKDLEQAKKIILIVGIDKVLRNRADALLHTQAMGIFGLESMLLDLAVRDDERYDFDGLHQLDQAAPPELHVILFDNKRSDILKNGYRELFTCIDCRACAGQCPVGQHLPCERGMVYSPRNHLMGFLQGQAPPFAACLHCGRCKVECPLDIDIPKLIWKSQIEHDERHSRGWKKRMLDNPESLAKLGSLTAPLSNWMTKLVPVKVLMETFAGIHRNAHLPAFHRKTFQAWLRGGRRD